METNEARKIEATGEKLRNRRRKVKRDISSELRHTQMSHEKSSVD